MRKIIFTMLAMAILFSMTVPAYAYNYQYESGADTKGTFGKPTQTDATPYNPDQENVRRNKDASFFPPAYGVFSGDIPTDATSPYHNNTHLPSAIDMTNYSASNNYDGSLQSTSLLADSSGSPLGDSGGLLISTSVMGSAANTLPSYYSDGSIGTLTIPKLNQTIKIYEGETLDNMKLGAGHFEFTSAWDGNIGVAGHNRGSAGYFEGVKNLKIGDRLTYETKYGKRTYEVYLKEQISDTDYSYLGWTQDNILTLITCVNDVPNKRWVVQCSEVR